MPRDRGLDRGQGSGVYSNAPPPGAYNPGNAYRQGSRGQPQIPTLLSNSWQSRPASYNHTQQQRNFGSEPLSWNRLQQSQGSAYHQQQDRRMGQGGMGYPPRRDERADRGRQPYNSGRNYPLPPSSGRYNWK